MYHTWSAEVRAFTELKCLGRQVVDADPEATDLGDLRFPKPVGLPAIDGYAP